MHTRCPLQAVPSWSAALADTLRRRGVKDTDASLIAEVGIAIFRIAFDRWIDDTNQQEFPQLVQASLDQLKALTVGEQSLAASATTQPKP
jgi:hypothetical protein